MQTTWNKNTNTNTNKWQQKERWYWFRRITAKEINEKSLMIFFYFPNWGLRGEKRSFWDRWTERERERGNSAEGDFLACLIKSWWEYSLHRKWQEHKIITTVQNTHRRKESFEDLLDRHHLFGNHLNEKTHFNRFKGFVEKIVSYSSISIFQDCFLCFIASREPFRCT